MNGCKGITSACTGLDLKPVVFGTPDEDRWLPEPIVMCAGCRSTALGGEARIVERRVMRTYVANDRRWKAPWRRNSHSKDLTRELVA